MSRGRTPVVAIGEAQRKAQAEGFVLILVDAEIKLPFDFVISDRGCISLVRVRRLKYAQYRVAEIQRLCDREIAEMRGLRIPEEIFLELWVRGPDREWHRYLILPDAIEMLDAGDDDSPDDGSQGTGSAATDLPGTNLSENGASWIRSGNAESTGNNSMDGSAPDGNAPDGNAPDGNAPDGNAPDGNAPDGTATDAGAADGDFMERNAPADRMPEGGTPDGNPPGGEGVASPPSPQAIPPAVQEPAPEDDEKTRAPVTEVSPE